MREASSELLASREEVWSFLAEPYHLADWWPGITGVDPDVRGFAPGARWTVHATKWNVFAGRRSVETMLLIREIDPYERWSFHILATKLDGEVRVRSTAPDRTLVTVAASKGSPALAVGRLYDLLQTAATM